MIRNPNHDKKLYTLIKENLSLSTKKLNELILSKLNTKASNLYNLKSRLKYKLISHILSDNSLLKTNLEIENNHHIAHQYHFANQILLINNNRLSEYFAKDCLNISIKYEFSELSYSVLRNIDTLSFFSNSIELQDLHIYFNKYSTLYLEEIKLEVIHFNLISSMTNRMNYHGAGLEKVAKDYNDRALLALKSWNTYKIIMYGYSIVLLYQMLTHNYRAIIITAEEALVMLNKKPYKFSNILNYLLIFKLIALINIEEYSEAYRIGKESAEKSIRMPFTWFTHNYYSVIACIYARNYLEAYETILIVNNHSNYKQLDNGRKQNHKIQLVYILLLIYRSKLDTTLTPYPTPPKFRLYKFLNDVPIYAKDKRGLNVAILIVHVLFLLHRKEYSKIIDRTDALKQYCYRYLKKDDTFRANCFIKMLIQLPRADFRKDLTLKYTRVYRQKLSTVPINVVEQGIENEIIPYEDLWELVLEMLD